MSDITFDFQRRDRIGLGEAVLCAGKTPEQIGEAIALAQARGASLLLTRLTPGVLGRLAPAELASLDYDARSHTALLGRAATLPSRARSASSALGPGNRPRVRAR